MKCIIRVIGQEHIHSTRCDACGRFFRILFSVTKDSKKYTRCLDCLKEDLSDQIHKIENPPVLTFMWQYNSSVSWSQRPDWLEEFDFVTVVRYNSGEREFFIQQYNRKYKEPIFLNDWIVNKTTIEGEPGDISIVSEREMREQLLERS